MNRELLETFTTIVRTRSLTKTSEAMFISQSAVSNRLLALEQELGVTLVERSPGHKGLRLTQKGEEFNEFVKRYLEIDRQVRQWRSGTFIEVLRVASVTSMCDYILNGFFYTLLEKRDLSITFSTHWTDRIISMLENRETDIGITPRVFYSKSVFSVPVFDEPLFLVHNKTVSDYPAEVDFRTVRRADEIYFDWGTGFTEWHDGLIDPLQTPLAVTDTPQIIPRLLQIPGSFSIIPEGMFRHYNDPELAISVITPTPPNRTCYLLRLKEPSDAQKSAVKNFEEAFRDYVKNIHNIILR